MIINKKNVAVIDGIMKKALFPILVDVDHKKLKNSIIDNYPTFKKDVVELLWSLKTIKTYGSDRIKISLLEYLIYSNTSVPKSDKVLITMGLIFADLYAKYY